MGHKKTAEEGRTKRNLFKTLNFGNLTEEIKVQIRYESPIEDSWSHRNQMCTDCTFKDFGHNSNQTGKYINIPANYSRPISSWMEWFGLGFYVEIFRENILTFLPIIPDPFLPGWNGLAWVFMWRYFGKNKGGPKYASIAKMKAGTTIIWLAVAGLAVLFFASEWHGKDILEWVPLYNIKYTREKIPEMS